MLLRCWGTPLSSSSSSACTGGSNAALSNDPQLTSGLRSLRRPGASIPRIFEHHFVFPARKGVDMEKSISNKRFEACFEGPYRCIWSKSHSPGFVLEAGSSAIAARTESTGSRGARQNRRRGSLRPSHTQARTRSLRSLHRILAGCSRVNPATDESLPASNTAEHRSGGANARRQDLAGSISPQLSERSLRLKASVHRLGKHVPRSSDELFVTRRTRRMVPTSCAGISGPVSASSSHRRPLQSAVPC